MSRKLVTNKQLDMLLDYMEADHSFVVDCTSSWANDLTRKHAVRQKWEQLAIKLNAVGGANRNGFKWRDYWSDKKRAVRKKALQGLHQDTGKGSSKRNTLSTSDLRVLSLVSVAVAAAKPDLSVRIPFDAPFEDTPPPAPISPTLPPMHAQDPPAGPSAPHHVQTPAASTTSEEMSPPLGADPQPEGKHELEDCLDAAKELCTELVKQMTTVIEQIEAGTEMQISKTKSIERDMSQVSEDIGFRANAMVADIDRLIEAKERKLASIEHIKSATEQLTTDAEQLKAVTERYTTSTEQGIAEMKSMERKMLKFSEDIRNAVNQSVAKFNRLVAAQKRKIDPMETNIITVTKQLIATSEQLISANKTLESAMLHFKEILDIAVNRVFNGLDRLVALSQVEESRRI